MGLFSKVVKAVTKPVRSVVKTAAKTAAGLFEDVTQPFLAPIDAVLDSLAPRFRVNAQVSGGVAASISGTTTHQIVLPQLGGLGQGLAVGDMTGGLLSDLAFDSDQLRRAENDLQFLVSAMRKGVYPHRNDTLFVGLAAVPAEGFSGDIWLRLDVGDESENQLLAELALTLRQEDIAAQRRNLTARLPLAANNSYDSDDLAAGMEQDEIVPLLTRTNMNTSVRATVRAFDAEGKETPGAFAQLAELTIWIERRNKGYADVLHRYRVAKPKASASAVFPINLVEYVSGGDEDRMRGLGDQREGGKLAGSVQSLRNALLSLSAPSKPESAAARSEPSLAANPLLQLLEERARRAETVRAQLWQARRDLVRPRQMDGKYDYRLRYKIRISNQSNKPRTVSSFEFGNVLGNGMPGPAAGVCRQFDLPAGCDYEATVYPLMHDADTVAKATVTLAEQGPHCYLSLIAGLGVAESPLRSTRLQPPAGQQHDSQSLKWSVADCCDA